VKSHFPTVIIDVVSASTSFACIFFREMGVVCFIFVSLNQTEFQGSVIELQMRLRVNEIHLTRECVHTLFLTTDARLVFKKLEFENKSFENEKNDVSVFS